MQIVPFIKNDPLLQGNQLKPILVLGLGNILLQDEGIGVRVVQQLQQDYLLPAQVEILDGGTAGMALYEHIIDRTHLIVIDAVNTGQPPGTLVTLEHAAIPAYFRTKVSPHQMALSDILAALQIGGQTLPEIILLGIVPVSLQTGIGLSDSVGDKLGTLLEMTVGALRNIGCEARPKLMH
jgi:hydrogenase maturation protease